LKEVINIYAEGLSGAEVLHGPLALIKKNETIILYLQNDATLNHMLALAQQMIKINAKLILIAAKNLIHQYQLKQLTNQSDMLYLLPLPPSLHPLCDPIIAMQTLYPALAKLAIDLKINPDHHPRLQKVTKTT